MEAPLYRIASCCRLQGAAADLVELHRLEQRAEIAFAEPFVAFALDDLEKNGADRRLGEDLQQQAAARGAVEEDVPRAQRLERLAVVRQALVDELVIRLRRVEQLHAPRAPPGGRGGGGVG